MNSVNAGRVILYDHRGYSFGITNPKNRGSCARVPGVWPVSNPGE